MFNTKSSRVYFLAVREKLEILENSEKIEFSVFAYVPKFSDSQDVRIKVLQKNLEFKRKSRKFRKNFKLELEVFRLTLKTKFYKKSLIYKKNQSRKFRKNIIFRSCIFIKVFKPFRTSDPKFYNKF